jgi:hypothetical protein
MALDRRQLLTQPGQDKLTGLDFIHVDATQTVLDVFFVRDPMVPPMAVAFAAPNDLTADHVVIQRIGSEEAPERIEATAVAWAVNDGRNVLRVTVAAPGGFALYRLTIEDPLGRIDPILNGLPFSFKAACPTELDCEAEPRPCPPEALVDFPVDYTARDFWSIRQALLDYASQRRPEWKDRLEADIGMMWAEALSALGDEFSYQSDAILQQAHLETATELRSIRRHARLVDYEIDDGQAAFTWLAVTVDPVIGAGTLQAGTRVWDTNRTIVFEVGRGLHDQAPNFHLGMLAGGAAWPMDASINRLEAYVWDENATCLFAGSTRLHVRGHHAVLLAGRRVILSVDPSVAGKPVRRWCVQLTGATNTSDPLPAVATPLTELTWARADAPPFDLDLEVLTVFGNVAPATAGETRHVAFQIGGPAVPPEGGLPGPVERIAADGAVIQLQGLEGTELHGLVWTDRGEARTRPDVALYEATPLGPDFRNDDAWTWRRSFVGTNSSQPTDTHFTLDDGLWRRVVGYRRVGGDIVHRDYATSQGSTVRLPDGQFGRAAPDGQIFQAVYRIFHGARGSVAADTLTGFDAAIAPFIQSVTNPLPASGGRDPENIVSIKESAPEAFRRVTFRAVRPEDYAAAAETLPWIQRAGATQRWTGSWLTTFVTADPVGSTRLTTPQRRQLAVTLDRYRQTGRDLATLDARYADLDLHIGICVEPTAYRGEVKERALVALFGEPGAFFSPDAFTFGTPLERSRLEAALQAVPGVRAVEEILIRRRGFFPLRPFTELVYWAGASTVIRVENSRQTPELGAVNLMMRGGA